MSRPPYSASGRFRSPLGQRLQSLRYRRERQAAERVKAEETRALIGVVLAMVVKR